MARTPKTLPVAAAIALASLVVSTTPGRADSSAMPLGDLIARSDRVVIGTVGVGEPVPDGQKAELLVREDLFGSGAPRLVLRGDPRDPSQPTFQSGTTVLVFAGVEDADGRVSVVGGDQGVVPLSKDDESVARALVETVSVRAGQLELVDSRPFLDAAGSNLPPRLVAALTAELAQRIDARQGYQLVDVVCHPSDNDERLTMLALDRIAALKIVDAAPCIEQIVRESADRELGVPAVEALGELREPSSFQTLMDLLPQVNPGPARPRLPAPVDPDQGPDFDPEDESNPHSDPLETDDATPQPTRERPPSPGAGPVSVEPDDDGAGLPPTAVAQQEDEPPVPPDAVGPEAVFDRGLVESAILALGKIGDNRAVQRIGRLGSFGDDLGLHSTVVTSLGLIGGRDAREQLARIQASHPHPLVRDLATQTLSRQQD